MLEVGKEVCKPNGNGEAELDEEIPDRTLRMSNQPIQVEAPFF